jgi:hypothetical protein
MMCYEIFTKCKQAVCSWHLAAAGKTFSFNYTFFFFFKLLVGIHLKFPEILQLHVLKEMRSVKNFCDFLSLHHVRQTIQDAGSILYYKK